MSIRIAVIGGGPAGSFFALRLLSDYRHRKDKPEIIILERKLFPKKGPSGCNLCAGLISSSMIKNLAKLGIEIPEGIIRNSIESYVYHAGGTSKEFSQFRDEKLFTVYRGGGPLSGEGTERKSFDQILLENAQSSGAGYLPAAVTDVVMPEKEDGPFTIKYNGGEELEADVVVGAFGLNTALIKKFSRLGFGYVPPDTMKVSQMEVYFPEGLPDYLQNTVHVFNTPFRSNVNFVALTPKRTHTTLTMIGENTDREDMQAFLQLPEIVNLFPAGWRPEKNYCSCYPRLASTHARRPYTDRLVIIGDAHVCRFYKNGIGSAFYTASVAAETISRFGTGASHFRGHYIAKCRRRYYHDNVYGKILFKLNDMVGQSDAYSRALLELAAEYEERYDKKDNLLHYILWSIFTGEEPYADIFRAVLRPRLQLELLFKFAGLLFAKSVKE